MKILAIMLTLVIVFAAPMSAMAEHPEAKAVSGDPVTGAVRTVGNAALGTAEVAASPIQALANGDGDQMVTSPVEKSGQTLKKVADDTGNTLTGKPVE